jgi:hypothetical protein
MLNTKSTKTITKTTKDGTKITKDHGGGSTAGHHLVPLVP